MWSEARAVLLIALLAASLALLIEQASAQPTWSFWADVSGALYPGETHNVTVILRNTECVEKREELRFSYQDGSYGPLLRNLGDDELERLKTIAEEAVSRGVFMSYRVLINQSGGVGGYVFHNVTVILRDYCVYKPIRVEKVRIWFPWRGYGRSLFSEVQVGEVLEGPDVSAFPLWRLRTARPNNPWRDPYLNLSVPFSVPAEIPSEFLGSQGIVVEVDAVTEGGRWTFGGPFGQPSVRVTGQVDVRPFRTFTLEVTDEEGTIPLGGAEVLLKAHVHPFEMSLTTNSSGTARVFRLPDQYQYRVTVFFRPPFLNASVPVLVTDVDARSLVNGIRTELHTLRIFPRDLKGRPLEGATVILRATELSLAKGVEMEPISNRTSNGYTSFVLLPTGNYSFSVLWRDVEVCSGSRYVGYHPTYGRRPNAFEVSCRVGDLRVKAVDGMGNTIGAEFSVFGQLRVSEDVTIVLEFKDYSKSGELVIEQVAPGVYKVEVVNRSRTFGKEVRGSGSVELGPEMGPESVLEVRLPVYGVRLTVTTADGEPLEEYQLEFGPVKLSAKGTATIAGVPEGEYQVKAVFRGVEVLSERLKVEGNVERALVARVFRTSFLLKDFDGEPVIAAWEVNGPGGSFSGGSSQGKTGPLPEAPHRLLVKGRILGKDVTLLNVTFLPSQLRNATLTVQALRPAFTVVWSDGTPFEGQLELPELGLKLNVVNGKARLEEKVLVGNYRVLVYDRAGNRVHEGRVGAVPGGSEVRVKAVPLTVRVVDVLGQPVAGASIQVRGSQGTILAEGVTDASGQLVIQRLPSLQAPFLTSASWGGRRVEGVSQGGELGLRVDVMNLGGAAVDPVLLVIGVVVVIGLGVFLFFRSRAKERNRGHRS